MRPLLMAILACTTFRVGDKVGKCYDWSMEQGLVLVNPKGLAKEALRLNPSERPARWTAKHASLTFNQYGRELPNGGINDSGLVVEVMWLDETQLPAPDDRPAVNELQWIQWALDRWTTVEELAQNALSLRVSRVSGRVHYLACDPTHACAALEYVGGKLVVTRGTDLPIPVLTNNTYSASLARFGGAGGAIPRGSGSLDRFVRAAHLVGLDEDPRKILDSVRNDASQWEIVYDMVGRSASWRTRSHAALKAVSLPKAATACPAAKMIDINTAGAGDVTGRLEPYRHEADLALLKKSLAGMRLPSGTAEQVAAYPDHLACP